MSSLLPSVIRNGTRTKITSTTFSGTRNGDMTNTVNLSSITNTLVLVEVICSNINYSNASYPFRYEFDSIRTGDAANLTLDSADIEIKYYPFNMTFYLIMQRVSYLTFHMPSYSGNSCNGIITQNFTIREGGIYTITGTTTINFYRLNI